MLSTLSMLSSQSRLSRLSRLSRWSRWWHSTLDPCFQSCSISRGSNIVVRSVTDWWRGSCSDGSSELRTGRPYTQPGMPHKRQHQPASREYTVQNYSTRIYLGLNMDTKYTILEIKYYIQLVQNRQPHQHGYILGMKFAINIGIYILYTHSTHLFLNKKCIDKLCI